MYLVPQGLPLAIPNQAYRVSTWGSDALKGANELTLGELRAVPPHSSATTC
jgi:hypothetical protein